MTEASKSNTRLLNIVMQLRKAANHPYLFEGIEDRSLPAYGEHMIFNCGKMVVIDKLLRRLRERGSRVLIFSQMTRQLDILEDYCVFREFEYCRIDGSTSSNARDEYMSEFNAEGSSKFIFLLSTRAGGLGVNLQTADVVILYDSDWNPQMDLQAQDRAHRIGQKKPVNVYRLVTEHTIEEKVVERAELKLRLDAMVIQQGRLAEKSAKVSKEEMAAMIRFGADEIFRSKDSSITDEDIEQILTRGAAKTDAMIKKLEEHTKGSDSMLQFSMDDPDAVSSTYMSMVGSNNDSEKDVNLKFLNKVTNALGKRGRQKGRRFVCVLSPAIALMRTPIFSYDVDAYYRDVMTADKKKRGLALPRPRRLPPLYDFQFFNATRLKELFDREMERWTKSLEVDDIELLPPGSLDSVEALGYRSRSCCRSPDRRGGEGERGAVGRRFHQLEQA